ncbi:MAG: 2-amino-4-hydroxy-6-hydroxymethyldihydropteridine diphosphokinase [candidate division WOR-3 bacterium]
MTVRSGRLLYIMAVAYLGLGANLGDRQANLEGAVAELRGLGLVRCSSWYETEPVDMPGAPLFLNGVVELKTGLGPEALFAQTRVIEQRRGRAPGPGPRAIDIDLLLYDSLVAALPGLVLPHPRMHLRPFVLVPLAELAPELCHPRLGVSVQALLARAGTSGVRLFVS